MSSNRRPIECIENGKKLYINHLECKENCQNLYISYHYYKENRDLFI